MTTTRGDHLTAVQELHELLLATDDFAGFLQQLAELATRTGSAQTSCGVTVRMDERPLTIASSDDLATRVDEVQYASQKGPCLQSMDTGEVVDVPDFAQEGRWDEFRMAAIANGLQSSLSTPIFVGSATVGAINLYSRTPQSFSEQDRRSAAMLAAQASGCLAVADRMAQHVELTTHLQAALASRSVIDQAIGIVMAQNRCNSDDAFDVLRRASQHRNIKLRQVAADIVTAVGGRPPTAGPPVT